MIEDITEVKRAEHAQRFLAAGRRACWPPAWTTSRRSAGSRELAVPRLADWCSVTLPRGDRLRAVAVAHVDPAKLELRARVPASATRRGSTRRPAPRRCCATGTSQLINHIDDELLAQASRTPSSASRCAQPRHARGDGRADGRRRARADRRRSRSSAPSPAAASARPTCELAEELGRRAGIAVENARLYRERSHIAADAAARACCPTRCRAIPGLRLSSLYRPAGAENLVGGDFYDAFPTDAGWMLLVGDVTGRGAEAAALDRAGAPHAAHGGPAAVAIPRRRCSSSTRRSPTGASSRRARSRSCMSRARTTDVLCAGHPQPAADPGRRAARRRALRPDARRVDATAAGSRSRWCWSPGDVLVLYTDGVTDAEGDDGALRRRASAGGAARRDGRRGRRRRHRRALNAFQVGPQADDTAVLALDLPVSLLDFGAERAMKIPTSEGTHGR